MYEISTTIDRSGFPSSHDTRKTKKALGQLGYLDQDEVDNPVLNMRDIDAVKRFQFDNGLKQDGVIKPGGETQNAMKDRLKTPKPSKKPEQKTAPKPERKPDACAAQKQAVGNAKAYLHRLLVEKKAEEDKIQILNNKINQIDEVLAKEKNESKVAKSIGHAASRPVGALIAAIPWPPAKVVGGALAAYPKLGKYIGGATEEVIDAVGEDKMTMTLKEEKNKLVKKRSGIRKYIKEHLASLIAKNRELVEKAQSAYNLCVKKY